MKPKKDQLVFLPRKLLNLFKLFYYELFHAVHLRIRLGHDVAYHKVKMYKQYTDSDVSKYVHRSVVASFIFSLLIFTTLQIGLPNIFSLTKPNKVQAAPVEMVDMRGASYKVYKNADGTSGIQNFPFPVHYQDATGKWQDIDLDIEDAGNNQLKLDKANYKLNLTKSSSQPLTFRIGDSQAVMDIEGVGSKEGVVDGARITYADVFMNTDLVREAKNVGFKQDFVLKAAGHPSSFVETFSGNSQIRLESDGTLGFYDKSGEKYATTPLPMLTDVNGLVAIGTFELAGKALTIKLPDISNMTYPITVDPSINHVPFWVDGTNNNVESSSNIDFSASPLKLSQQVIDSTPFPTPIDGYQYLRRVSITNGSASEIVSGKAVSAQFDHKTLVDNGKSLASGNDLRVYYWDTTLNEGAGGLREINRIAENDWNITTTKVWFNLQTNLAASENNANYYLAYGNPSAGEPVTTGILDFTDNFNSGSLSQWTEQDTASNYVQAAGGKLVLTGGTSAWGAVGAYTNSSVSRADGNILEFDYKWTGGNNIMFGYKNDTAGFSSYTDLVHGLYTQGTTVSAKCNSSDKYASTLYHVTSVYENGTGSNVGSVCPYTAGTFTSYHWALNTQYRIRIYAKTTSGATYQRSTDNGQTWATFYDSTNAAINNTPLRIGITNYAGQGQFDNFIIRKSPAGTSLYDPATTVGPTEGGTGGGVAAAYYTSGNFISTNNSTTIPETQGYLTSVAIDGTTPGGTTLKFQVAASDTGSFGSFVGPDGTTATYFDASHLSFTATSNYIRGKYFKYKAYFETTYLAATPTLTSLTINYTVTVSGDTEGGDLVINNTSYAMTGETTKNYNSILVTTNGTLTIPGNTTVNVTNGIIVESNSNIVTQITNTNYSAPGVGVVFNSASVNVAAGCSINADGTGYISDTGPYLSSLSAYDGMYYNGGGGGNAGVGAMSRNGYASGKREFSASDLNALYPGSAGRSGYPPASPGVNGGSGGGAFSMRVTTLVNNGRISSNGAPGKPWGYNVGGSGAGGSVAIYASEVSGAGSISADGGAAFTTNSGGGGGGYVNIRYAVTSTNTFSVNGGAGTYSGGLGFANVQKVAPDLNAFSSQQNDNTTLSHFKTGEYITTDNNIVLRAWLKNSASSSIYVKFQIEVEDSSQPFVDDGSLIEGVNQFTSSTQALNSSPALLSVAVPKTALTNGQTYKWRARTIGVDDVLQKGTWFYYGANYGPGDTGLAVSDAAQDNGDFDFGYGSGSNVVSPAYPGFKINLDKNYTNVQPDLKIRQSKLELTNTVGTTLYALNLGSNVDLSTDTLKFTDNNTKLVTVTGAKIATSSIDWTGTNTNNITVGAGELTVSGAVTVGQNKSIGIGGVGSKLTTGDLSLGTNGTVALSGDAAVISTGSLSVGSGTSFTSVTNTKFTSTGNVTNNGTLTFGSISTAANSLTTAGSVTNTGTMNLGTNAVTLATTELTTNGGTLVLPTASILTASTVTQTSGNITFGATATLNIASGYTHTAGTLTLGDNSIVNTPAITQNNGTIQLGSYTNQTDVFPQTTSFNMNNGSLLGGNKITLDIYYNKYGTSGLGFNYTLGTISLGQYANVTNNTMPSLTLDSPGKIFVLGNNSSITSNSIVISGGSFTLGDNTNITPITINLDAFTLNSGSLTLPSNVTLNRSTDFVVGNTAVATMTIGGKSRFDITNNKLTLKNSSSIIPQGYYTITTSPNYNGRGLEINAKDLEIQAGSKINATGQGYLKQTGPGITAGYYSGAGYGSAGAQGYSGTPGPAYGNSANPIDLGSGGYDGDGGGAIKLSVSNTLNNSGSILADGYTPPFAPSSLARSGSSGGSIIINTGILSGNGAIYARGANGNHSNAAAGGGGRAAIFYSDKSNWTGTALTAAAIVPGGTGIYAAAAAGTLYMPPAKPNITANPIVGGNIQWSWSEGDVTDSTADPNQKGFWVFPGTSNHTSGVSTSVASGYLDDTSQNFTTACGGSCASKYLVDTNGNVFVINSVTATRLNVTGTPVNGSYFIESANFLAKKQGGVAGNYSWDQAISAGYNSALTIHIYAFMNNAFSLASNSATASTPIEPIGNANIDISKTTKERLVVYPSGAAYQAATQPTNFDLGNSHVCYYLYDASNSLTNTYCAADHAIPSFEGVNWRYAFTGLTPNKSYYAKVEAYNQGNVSAGQSAASDSVVTKPQDLNPFSGYADNGLLICADVTCVVPWDLFPVNGFRSQKQLYFKNQVGSTNGGFGEGSLAEIHYFFDVWPTGPDPLTNGGDYDGVMTSGNSPGMIHSPTAFVDDGLVYLHAVGYNSAGAPGDVLNVGPYKMDTNGPVVTNVPGVFDTTWHKTNDLTYDVDFADSYSGLKNLSLGISATGPWYDVTPAGFNTPYTGSWQPSAAFWTALPQGKSDIYVKADDQVDNPTIIKINEVKKDNLAMTTTLVSSPVANDGDNGYFRTNPVITLTAAESDPATASGLSKIYYRWGSGSDIEYSTPVNMNTTIGQGVHDFTYWAVDNIGNIENTHTINYKLDSVIPDETGYSTSPVSYDGDNGYFKTNAIITLLSSDTAPSSNDGHAYTIRYAWDDLAGLTSEPRTYDQVNKLNMLTDIGEGTHTLYYRGYDYAGNPEASVQSETIKLDKTKPTIDTFSSNAGDNINDANRVVTITINATDTGTSDFDYYELANEDDVWVTTDIATVGSTYSVNNIQWTLTENEGTKTVKIRFKDKAGNYSDVTEKTLVYDITAPTSFSLVSPADNYWQNVTAKPTLAWGASSDSGTDIQKYQLYIDGTLNREIIPSSTDITPMENLSQSLHAWYIVAIDNAGNTTTSSNTYHIGYDINAPSKVLMPGFRVTATTNLSGTINIDWSDYRDDTGTTSPVSTYTIERLKASYLDGTHTYYSNNWSDFSADSTSGYRLRTKLGTDTRLLTDTSTSLGGDLEDSLRYVYRVKAGDTAGNAGSWMAYSFGLTADTIPPTDPSAVTAVVCSTDHPEACSNPSNVGYEIKLTWTGSNDLGSGVTGYKIYRIAEADSSDKANYKLVGYLHVAQAPEIPTTTEWSDNDNNNASSYYESIKGVNTLIKSASGANDLRINDSTNYYYRITALDSDGNESDVITDDGGIPPLVTATNQKATVTPDMTAPLFPTSSDPNFKVVETTPMGLDGVADESDPKQRIDVSWQPATDGRTAGRVPVGSGSGIKEYKLYSATNEAGPYSLVTTTAADVTTYSHVRLEEYTFYYYKVEVVDNVDRNSISGITAARTATSSVPSTPGNISVAAVKGDPTSVAEVGEKITISFMGSRIRYTENKITGYEVYRSTNPNETNWIDEVKKVKTISGLDIIGGSYDAGDSACGEVEFPDEFHTMGHLRCFSDTVPDDATTYYYKIRAVGYNESNIEISGSPIVYSPVSAINQSTIGSGWDTVPDTMAPNLPTELKVKDIHDDGTNFKRNIITWARIATPTRAGVNDFREYRIYRSTDGLIWSQILNDQGNNPLKSMDGSLSYAQNQEISLATNYYMDLIPLSEANRYYYYYISAVDDAGDVYKYSVGSMDVINKLGGTVYYNESQNGKDQIVSLNPAIAKPSIMNQPSGLKGTLAEVGVASATITWTTDQNTDSIVEFRKKGTTDPFIGTIDRSFGINHSVTIKPLDPSTEYEYRLVSRNFLANDAVAENTGGSYSVLPRLVTSGFTVTPGSVTATTSTVEISWTTNLDASSAFVEYQLQRNPGDEAQGGTSGVEPAVIAASPKNHRVVIKGLKSNRTFNYKIKSISKDGYTTEDPIIGFSTFKTRNFDTDQFTIAPNSSNVAERNINATTAQIVWETSVPATSWVDYSTTSGVYDVSSGNNDLVTTHVVLLEGLVPGNRYYYRVRVKDANEVEYTSAETSFVAILKPKISNMKIKDVTPYSATISWDTNVDTETVINWGKTAGYGEKKGTQGLSKVHEIKVEGLEDNQEYHYQILAKDEAGNEVADEDKMVRTPLDTEGPKITGVKIDVLPMGESDSTSSIIVSWQTNKPATTLVEYGEGVIGGTYDKRSVEDLTLNNSHTVIIKGLTPASSYHYRLVSADKRNNKTVSQDYTFVTPSKEKSILQLILKSLEETFSWTKNLNQFFGNIGKRLTGR